jgi:hypothetical protein
MELMLIAIVAFQVVFGTVLANLVFGGIGAVIFGVLALAFFMHPFKLPRVYRLGR